MADVKSLGVINGDIFRTVYFDSKPVSKVIMDDNEVFDSSYWLIRGDNVIEDEYGLRLSSGYPSEPGRGYGIKDYTAVLNYNYSSSAFDLARIASRSRDYLINLGVPGNQKYSCLIDVKADITVAGVDMSKVNCFLSISPAFGTDLKLQYAGDAGKREIITGGITTNSMEQTYGNKTHGLFRGIIEIDAEAGYNFLITKDYLFNDIAIAGDLYSTGFTSAGAGRAVVAISVQNFVFCRTELKEQVKKLFVRTGLDQV